MDWPISWEDVKRDLESVKPVIYSLHGQNNFGELFNTLVNDVNTHTTVKESVVLNDVSEFWSLIPVNGSDVIFTYHYGNLISIKSETIVTHFYNGSAPKPRQVVLTLKLWVPDESTVGKGNMCDFNWTLAYVNENTTLCFKNHVCYDANVG